MAESLFETGDETPRTGVPPEDAPLAARMRPRDLDEFVGQSHLLEPGSALRVAIESGEPHSGDLLRAAGHREDDAGADHRGAGQGRLRGALGGQRRTRRGA